MGALHLRGHLHPIVGAGTLTSSLIPLFTIWCRKLIEGAERISAINVALVILVSCTFFQQKQFLLGVVLCYLCTAYGVFFSSYPVYNNLIM